MGVSQCLLGWFTEVSPVAVLTYSPIQLQQCPASLSRRFLTISLGLLPWFSDCWIIQRNLGGGKRVKRNLPLGNTNVDCTEDVRCRLCWTFFSPTRGWMMNWRKCLQRRDSVAKFITALGTNFQESRQARETARRFNSNIRNQIYMAWSWPLGGPEWLQKNRCSRKSEIKSTFARRVHTRYVSA